MRAIKALPLFIFAVCVLFCCKPKVNMVIDTKNMNAGQEYGIFTIQKCQYEKTDNYEMAAATLYGEQKISGRYKYYDIMDENMPDVLFFIPDSKSYKLIPQFDLYNNKIVGFELLFADANERINVIHNGNSGLITVIIDSLQLNYLPKDSWNIANVKSVESIHAN